MQKFVTRILAAFAVFAALPAGAIYPESGWYWNANEGGRGFNIEIQDNQIFMSAFVYRADGTPVWYVAGGPMTDDKNFSADLFETSGGQCLGCAYRPATATKVGTATILFASERAATITLAGTTISVVRQDWSGYGSNSRDALMGEWSSTEGDPAVPVYTGDRITLKTPLSDAQGPYVQGHLTGSTTNVAVGEFNQSTGTFDIILDSSTQYYKLYIFGLNAFNRAEGAVWTYLKTGAPAGTGTYYVAHRTKSGAYVRSGVGPAIFKSAQVGVREAADARAAEASAAAGAAPAEVLNAARRLEALLKQR